MSQIMTREPNKHMPRSINSQGGGGGSFRPVGLTKFNYIRSIPWKIEGVQGVQTSTL